MLSDVAITERQKRVLIDVYQSFVKENEKDGALPEPEPGTGASDTTDPRSPQNKTTNEGE